MKKLVISASLFLGACCPAASVAPNPHASAAWNASTIDMAPAAVHAQLGLPISAGPSTVIGEDECFAVTAPFTKRCVHYVGGLVMFDNSTSRVPADQLLATFDHVVKAQTQVLGAPTSRIHFTFVPGEDVLGMWKGRGFRFGETCVLESARKKAETDTPGGLAFDAPQLKEAAINGAACVRADWDSGASVLNRGIDGDDAPAGMYELTVHYHSMDPARAQMYQEAMDAGTRQLMQDMEKLDRDIESLKADDEGSEGDSDGKSAE